MILIKSLNKLHMDGRAAITLGKFDGLHRGHRELIRQTVKKAEEGLCPTVFAFDISPMTILTKPERRRMLEKMGVGCLVECPFTPSVITMSPEEFVSEILVGKMNAAHLVVGPDFRFGYEREGDVSLLERLGQQFGFTVETVPLVRDSEGEISSSRIRRQLSLGEMEKVNAMLGYSFFITGEIVHGRHIGRTLGVPTTNIIPDGAKLLPPNGVYASETKVGGKLYRGITDIGTKPTVDGQFIGVETYLFDCDDNLYGEQEKVRILSHRREEKKFASIAELQEQLKKDETDGRAYFRK